MDLRWLAVLLLGFWLAAVHAQDIRVTGTESWPLKLDRRVQRLEDPSGRMSLADVLALAPDARHGFAPGTPALMRPAFSRSAFWLRAGFVNDSGVRQSLRFVLDSTWLQQVDFYLRRGSDPAAPWTRKAAGVAVPAQPGDTRVPTLAIELPPGEHAQLLVRLRSESSVNFPPRLYNVRSLNGRESRRALFDGLLIGGLLVLAAYSLALWVLSRGPALGWQSLGLALVALYEAAWRGQARLYLWPDSPGWAYRAPGALAGCCALVLLLYLYGLTRGTAVRPPGLRLLAGLAAVETVIVGGTLLGPYAPFAQAGVLMALVLVCAVTVCSFLYLRRAGLGGALVFPAVLVIALGVGLSLIELSIPGPSVTGLDPHAMGFPGMLLGLVALACWTHHLSRQGRQAQHTLMQWQAHEPERLQHEIERKTQALNSALAQAEARTQEQARLMAHIGHDLRAPLSTIVGHARLLRERAQPAHAPHLQAIERSADHQLALISELVEFAKGEMTPLELEPQPTHLPGLIEDLGQYGAALALRQKNKFVLERSDTLPEVLQLDSKRLQRVLLNLLSNAAKFTRGGRIGLKVEARRQDDDAWRIAFEVWDTGIGIDKADQRRIFEAFAQADAMPGSHGLGLFIARRIVQRMGGELALVSRRGAGSRLSFALTLSESSAAAVAARVAPAPFAVSPSPSSSIQAGSAAAHAPEVSAHAWKEFDELVRSGRWSDLHEWTDRLAASDRRHAALAAAVREALDTLDFDELERLSSR
jgi:signal transduction histidine kinase